MTDPESISLGGSLPQWMRMRPDARLDADGGTSFGSPPAHDDSFFYIRYPIGGGQQQPQQKAGDATATTGASGQIQSLTQALSDVQVKSAAEANNALRAAQHTVTPAEAEKMKQFAKHTAPCKMFLTQNTENPAAPLPTFAHVKNQTKPFGTDDGFDGEGAACGTSIVRVARQMVSGKSLSRGFTVANFTGDLEAHPEQHPSDDEQRYIAHPRNQHRRGSKSLPASPLGSPKSMRRGQPNPYFCGPGYGGGGGGGNSSHASAANSGTHTPVAGGHGWFLSGLLGYQRGGDLAGSTTSVVSQIHEEVEEAHEVHIGGGGGGAGAAGGPGAGAGLQLATQAAKLTAVPNTNTSVASSGSGSNTSSSSSASTSSAAATGTTGSFLAAPSRVLKARPSELREMNFWSPTSM